ncbi:MAG: O-antigen ligase family protein [Desulfobacterales bacterium]
MIYLIHNYPLFLDKLLTILCVVSSLFAIVYATKFYINHPFPETRLAGYALLFNPIRASSLYGTLGISCFYLIHRYNSTKALFVYLLILLPIIFFIILSQSRGPLLSLSIILFLFFVMFAKTFKVNGQSIYLLSSSIIILFIILIFIGFYYDYFTGLMFNRGLSYRSEIWLAFLKFLKHKFLFGYGLGADSSVKVTDGTIFLHPHNVYIATFYYGGVIGLLLQINVLCTSVFYSFFQDKSYNSILFGLMVLFGFLCIITDGNLIIQHPKPFWIFFWFPIAIISALELKNKNITFI